MTTGNFWLDQIKVDEIKDIIQSLVSEYIGEDLDADMVEEIEIRLKKRLDNYQFEADFEFDGDSLSIYIVAYDTELLFTVDLE